LDGVRHEDVFESLRQSVALPRTPDTAGLSERLDDLLDEERVALRPAYEQGLKVIGQTLGDEHRARHRDAVSDR